MNEGFALNKALELIGQLVASDGDGVIVESGEAADLFEAAAEFWNEMDAQSYERGDKALAHVRIIEHLTNELEDVLGEDARERKSIIDADNYIDAYFRESK